MTKMGTCLTFFLILVATQLSAVVGCDTHHDDDDKVLGKAKLMYQWNLVEYEWPSASAKQNAINSGSYIPTNSAINGIKLYKDRVFVTVPRLKTGVPATLSEVVENADNTTSVSRVLRPFPNWEMQQLGNCTALQRVQSMEIDPKTGHMWIMDTGYTPKMKNVTVQPIDACPAKMIVYDINNNVEIRRYHFPTSIIGHGLFYLNDIVLDVHNGDARYAYMSDTLDYKLVVYDFLKDESYAYTHPNMRADKTYENITISNLTMTGIITGINGIAMSPDFRYVYYSSVAGIGLHQIETSVLRSARGDERAFAASVRTVGSKISPGDGMAYGAKHSLYYSALGSNSVYKWDIKKDLGSDAAFGDVMLKSQSALVTDPRMEWIDTLALDECGYLWFTTSRLNKFFSTDGVVHHEPNFYIWKVYVDDYNYLDPEWNEPGTSGGSDLHCISVTVLIMVACALLAILKY